MKKATIITYLSILVILTLFFNFRHANPVQGEIYSITNPSSAAIDKSNWKYTQLELISEGMVGDSYYPDIALDSQENIHVVWHDYSNYMSSGTDGAILYRYFDVVTETWSSIFFISEECDAGSVYSALAIDSQDNLHVVWEDTSTYGSSGADRDIMYRFYDAATELWQTTEVVSTESTSNSFKPDIVTDNDGNVHVCWNDPTDYNFEGSDYDIFYKYKSITSGLWTTTKVVSSNFGGGTSDPTLNVDSLGNIHFFWADATDYLGAGTDYDIFHKIYYPYADFWSAVYVVSTMSNDFSLTPSIVLDEEDNIHLVWEDSANFLGSGGGEQDIFYRCFIKSLGTWGTTSVVSKESTSSSYPNSAGQNIALDSEGNVHITWFDPIYGESLWNAVYRILYKDTNIWSNVDVISMESTSQSRYPIICIDSADHVYFSWTDDDNLLSSGSDNDIFLRKYAGPPSQPFLEEIIPNPTNSSNVTLIWSPVPGAKSYTVHRSESHIYSGDTFSSLASTTNTYYNDTLSAEGVYYYAIVAENDLGQSIVSNCEYVIYDLSGQTTPNGTSFGFSILGTLILLGVLVISLRISRKLRKSN